MFLKRTWRALLACGAVSILGFLFTGSPVEATTIIPSSERGMTQRADAIVMGTVTSIESRWNVDRSLIYTDIGIDVSRTLKAGPYPSTGRIVISLMGGTVGGLRMEVDQQAVFERGEEVLLFLVANPKTNSYTTYAMSYGKYIITTDPNTGHKMIDGPSFHHYQHYNPISMQREMSVVRSGRMKVDEFISEINRYLTN